MARFRIVNDQSDVDLPAGSVVEVPGSGDDFKELVKNGDAIALPDVATPQPLPGTVPVPGQPLPPGTVPPRPGERPDVTTPPVPPPPRGKG